MPQPGEAAQPTPSAEDSFLELLVEILEGLDESVRGQFLRQFFHTIAQIDLTEIQSNEYWDRTLVRRRELTDSLGKRVSLKTALVDVLASASFLRIPILIEYDDFKKLRINAATDALTGLYNRRLFDEYCDKELNRAKRYNQQLAVVILDLHRLKDVNDRYGHLQGDQVLQLAAATLRKTLRASDFAFRIGGDEFALLLPQTDPEQAITLSRRVRTQYENDIRPLQIDIGVTLDFGVAVYPHDGSQKSELMGLADKRLYELKNSSRRPVRVPPVEAQPIREAPMPLPIMPTPGAPTIPRQVPTSMPNRAAATDLRKWERVSLSGTKAHAILTEPGPRTAKVIDLSYGGVALLLDEEDDIPAQFNAVLHVPILPPVRVVLRKVYALRLADGRLRIGCSFVS